MVHAGIRGGAATHIGRLTQFVLCGSVLFVLSDSSEARFPRMENRLDAVGDLQFASLI